MIGTGSFQLPIGTQGLGGCCIPLWVPRVHYLSVLLAPLIHPASSCLAAAVRGAGFMGSGPVIGSPVSQSSVAMAQLSPLVAQIKQLSRFCGSGLQAALKSPHDLTTLSSIHLQDKYY